MPLSDRIRPNSEAAPWVVEEVKTLESKLELAQNRLRAVENALICAGFVYNSGVPVYDQVGDALSRLRREIAEEKTATARMRDERDRETELRREAERKLYEQNRA